MSLPPAASVEGSLEISEGRCAISFSLDVQDIINSVQDDRAGAIAVFVGTTRNSFKGKTVTRLEYQAYTKLALKTMAEIIHEANHPTPPVEHQPPHDPTYVASLIRCVIHHRIGTVPVGEPSIVVAVSSPHRKEAFLACEKILEDVKRKAQVWKREYYEGEDESKAEWKENY
ncbi:MoaE-domain-containing protein [Macrolepiota fuliginosa MF-IS2]|uniref:MoaE-domain-containing protein n=1 Tax=Macrolepiota fuliginosa MF-IS2 TaxID=1400762 RepID=A0A9P6C9D3_9AGAR|nr:MoaE-domain-containing protein [Macrolepiota fuliginosa MF-IS2]